MIRINLLPKGMRPAGPSWFSGIPWKKVGVSAGAFLLLYSAWLFIANGIQVRTLSGLSAEWESLKDQRGRLDQTQAALRALQNRAVILQAIKSPQSQWAPRLNLLSDALVSDLWFTQVKIGSAAPPPGSPVPPQPNRSSAKGHAPEPGSLVTLTLRGSAFVTTSGGGAPESRYQQRLQQQPEFKKMFKGLVLTSVQHQKVHDYEVSDFVITLYPSGS